MFDDAHVGRRVIYTDRSGKVHNGSIREVIASVKQIDFDGDNSKRTHFYVPFDTVKFEQED